MASTHPIYLTIWNFIGVKYSPSMKQNTWGKSCPKLFASLRTILFCPNSIPNPYTSWMCRLILSSISTRCIRHTHDPITSMELSIWKETNTRHLVAYTRCMFNLLTWCSIDYKAFLWGLRKLIEKRGDQNKEEVCLCFVTAVISIFENVSL